MVKVSLTRIEKDPYQALIKAFDDIGERPVSKGDCVLIKPNLVNPSTPDSGNITNSVIIEAVARYCLDQGAARVIIGEGPSYYLPEPRLRECFTGTGVSDIADRLGIEWVLFDEHHYRTYRDIADCTPEEFRVTELAFACDKLINLPVLKTHYQTRVTLAMKNLKGCLKRADKPRFHYRDLHRAVVELSQIIRPTVNIIDASTWKKGGGLLITSSDIVAVDAVGCALMGIDPAEVGMITIGAAYGLGESDLTRIDIKGEEIKKLKFDVKLPQEHLRESFPLLEIRGGEKACSGCLIPLFSALSTLEERGLKPERPLVIVLGKDVKIPESKGWLLVGDCAQIDGISQENLISGCPPDRQELLDGLIRAMASRLG